MDNLIIEKNLNSFIRQELNMSVSHKLKGRINETVLKLLTDASERAKEEGRKTILPRHI